MEAKADKIAWEREARQQIIQKRRGQEAEEAYQQRQQWLTNQRRELHQEGVAISKAVLKDIIEVAMIAGEEATIRKFHYKPELTETAARRMWCNRCEQRGHEERNCPQPEEEEDTSED